jgi:Fur family ferric uptake transcriptional regulator
VDQASALREAGLSVTAGRVAVLAAVDAHPHAPADVIAAAARERIGTLSLQSVYDSLGVLVESGLVRRIQPAGSPARFENRVADNHHHLVCRICQAVVDVDCAVGDTPCLTAADDAGFEVDEAEVAYWGRCPDCVAAGRTSPVVAAGARRPRDPSSAHDTMATASASDAPSST